MVEQLKLASQDESRQVGASIQLIAVLALIRELRHLDKLKRWRATGQDLVEARDRRYLLDESIRYFARFGVAVARSDRQDDRRRC
ncbi:hypothetical protein [Pseudomonas aeruginosa]|uniref:hypothetical protein n=1 Tax=Pseudomonas aeruginosa TaxID=287 RepID=UPI0011C05B2A|nr:hypothetical protein [Pseudomonas aeruginosa]